MSLLQIDKCQLTYSPIAVIVKSVEYKKDRVYYDGLIGTMPHEALKMAEKLSDSLKNR